MRDRDDRLDIETVFLEMRQRPTRPPAVAPDGIDVALERTPSVSFYRYLYAGVGERWLWFERDRMDDAELRRLITAPGIEIHVLRCEGSVAGYVELDARGAAQTQILYFGLLGEFIGRGLGRFFLDWTVDHAFARPIERLWVHTCSLDHPRALPTYRRAGFSEYRRVRDSIRDPRKEPVSGGR